MRHYGTRCLPVRGTFRRAWGKMTVGDQGSRTSDRQLRHASVYCGQKLPMRQSCGDSFFMGLTALNFQDRKGRDGSSHDLDLLAHLRARGIWRLVGRLLSESKPRPST